MSDQGPPDWFDNAPPPSADGGVPVGAGGQRKKRTDAPKMTAEQHAAETEAFLGWLTAPERAKELRVTSFAMTKF